MSKLKCGGCGSDYYTSTEKCDSPECNWNRYKEDELKCPNCNNKMYLVNKDKSIQIYKYDKIGFYDIWECKNCPHIKVLDWRFD